MRNLLHAFVRSLLHNPVPRWINMSGRTGQSVGPPNGGGIKDDVLLGPIVESGAVLAHGFSIDGGIAFRDDAHAGQVHGRGPVPLPSQETFDGVSFLHSRPRKKPMLRHGAGPIATSPCRDRSFDLCPTVLPSTALHPAPCSFQSCDG